MSKPLSLNEIRSRAAQFVIDWRDSPGDERQDAQSFVRDLLHVYGITDTRAALYEKRAQRSSTASRGYIDALVPGQLLVEMKSVGKNLGLSEVQALDKVVDKAFGAITTLRSNEERLQVLFERYAELTDA